MTVARKHCVHIYVWIYVISRFVWFFYKKWSCLNLWPRFGIRFSDWSLQTCALVARARHPKIWYITCNWTNAESINDHAFYVEVTKDSFSSFVRLVWLLRRFRPVEWAITYRARHKPMPTFDLFSVIPMYRSALAFSQRPPTEHSSNQTMPMHSLCPALIRRNTFDYYLDNNDRTCTVNKDDRIMKMNGRIGGVQDRKCAA